MRFYEFKTIKPIKPLTPAQARINALISIRATFARIDIKIFIVNLK